MKTKLTEDSPLPKIPLIANVHGTILNNGTPNSIRIYFINNGGNDIVFNDKDNETGAALIEIEYYIDKSKGNNIIRPDALMRTDSEVTFSGNQLMSHGVPHFKDDGDVYSVPVSLEPEKAFTVAPNEAFYLEAENIITDFPARQANLFVKFKNVYYSNGKLEFDDTNVVVPVQISPIYTGENITCGNVLNIENSLKFSKEPPFLNIAIKFLILYDETDLPPIDLKTTFGSYRPLANYDIFDFKIFTPPEGYTTKRLSKQEYSYSNKNYKLKISCQMINQKLVLTVTINELNTFIEEAIFGYIQFSHKKFGHSDYDLTANMGDEWSSPKKSDS